MCVAQHRAREEILDDTKTVILRGDFNLIRQQILHGCSTVMANFSLYVSPKRKPQTDVQGKYQIGTRPSSFARFARRNPSAQDRGRRKKNTVGCIPKTSSAEVFAGTHRLRSDDPKAAAGCLLDSKIERDDAEFLPHRSLRFTICSVHGTSQGRSNLAPVVGFVQLTRLAILPRMLGSCFAS